MADTVAVAALTHPSLARQGHTGQVILTLVCQATHATQVHPTQAAVALVHPDNIGQEVRQEARVLLPIRGVCLGHHQILHKVVVDQGTIGAETHAIQTQAIQDMVLVVLVLLLLEDVAAAGLIPDPAHANRPHRKDAIMYQPQAAAADFTGTLVHVLAAQQERPQRLAAAEEHPAAHVHRDITGCLTAEAGACLIAQAGALLELLQHRAEEQRAVLALRGLTGCLITADGACPMAVPAEAQHQQQLQLNLLLQQPNLNQLQRQLNQLNRLQLHLQVSQLQPPPPNKTKRNDFLR